MEKLTDAVDCTFKLQASYGFILQHAETEEQRYFHPSQNNAGVFDKPPLISGRKHLEEAVDEILDFDPLEWARNHRPNTKWRVLIVTQLTCYLNRLKDFPIGAKCHNVPRYVSRNKGLDQLSSTNLFDQLCIFRCLAKHRNNEKENEHILCKQMGHNPKTFKGVLLSELDSIEKYFEVQIWVYSLEREMDKTSAMLLRRSPFRFKDRMNVDLCNGHFSLIFDMNKYSSHFPCIKCGHVSRKAFNAQRHERSCRQNVNEIFPGGIYKPKPSLFDELHDLGIDVSQHRRIYPYRCVFDIEVFFSQRKMPSNSESTEWENLHEPASIGVTSNVRHFTDGKCFISEGDSQSLVNDFMEYLEQISNEAYRRLKIKFREVTMQLKELINKEQNKCEQLEQSLGDLYDQSETRHLKHIINVKTKLQKWMERLIVLGFNSGRYDLNVLLPFIVDFCKTQDLPVQPLKRGGKFISLTCGNIQFLDICNYLGAGTSYSKYLKAYNPEGEMKSFFPYEWFTCLEKLNETSLPPHEAFHSTLKGSNISNEEYESCQKIWIEKEMKTMKDYLVHYQMLDVRPFLVAISNQIAFYSEKGLDLFKSAYSLPGISFLYVFQTSPQARFMLFNKTESNVCKALQKQMTGGPSIVFSREAEVNKSKIKSHIYGDKAKTVQSILGFDSNSLYLSCTGDYMPTGFMRRRKCPSFSLSHSSRSVKAVEWMEYMSHKSGRKILHELNRWPLSEKRIGGKRYSVDGFFEDEDKISHVYEMHGCFYHGHSCLVGQGKRYSSSMSHPLNDRVTWGDLIRQTKLRDEYIRNLPNTKLTVMYECEWEEIKKKNPSISVFLKNSIHFTSKFKVRPKSELEDITKMVLNGDLFGIVWCDVHVPDERKDFFASFPPIFKHANISIEDIGEHMKKHCEENKLLNKPRRLLISSYHGEAILVATPLLQWYLANGLVMTKVYEILEFQKTKCFSDFQNTVTKARRSGDAHPDLKIVGETLKLLGNAFYGKCNENKSKHINSNFYTESEAAIKVNDGHFINLSEIGEKYYEVQSSKKTIKYDLPILIPFFVYSYAKLVLLKFNYDFMKRHIPPSMMEEIVCDTDSMYYKFARSSLNSCVAPSMRRRFFSCFKDYCPSPACDEHYDLFVEVMVNGKRWHQPPCCVEREKFDQRTPRLFKLEAKGDSIVALNSKTYYLSTPSDVPDKVSSKGLSKVQNSLSILDYRQVLQTEKPSGGTNIGFRMGLNVKNMYTYSQKRNALSYLYIKRKVDADGVSTYPLDI